MRFTSFTGILRPCSLKGWTVWGLPPLSKSAKEVTMNDSDLNSRIMARGKELFSVISGEKPSLFDKGAWMGKVMDWCMKNEAFKVRMFRFVDVFPSLTTGKLLADH